MKILMIAALAAVPAAFATPAHAQSANDMMRYDEANDPGYQSAMRGGRYNGGYDNRYYNNGSFVDNTNAIVECKSKSLFILFGTSKCTRRPAAQMCYTPGGDPIILDGDTGRFPAGYVPNRAIPEQVTVNCGGNTYSAKMAR